METSLENALYLMLMGMSSVFVVLAIVVYGGKMLIYAVNTLSSQSTPPPLVNPPSTNNQDAVHLAVLTAAVEVLTQGKGSIESFQKLKK